MFSILLEVVMVHVPVFSICRPSWTFNVADCVMDPSLTSVPKLSLSVSVVVAPISSEPVFWKIGAMDTDLSSMRFPVLRMKEEAGDVIVGTRILAALCSPLMFRMSSLLM